MRQPKTKTLPPLNVRVLIGKNNLVTTEIRYDKWTLFGIKSEWKPYLRVPFCHWAKEFYTVEAAYLAIDLENQKTNLIVK
tara:strand:+ start:227 stop:466 length:240 start_codon:yes stop_codon:yes gene_type:complete